ncbi:MAG: hypothetical protein C0603_08930 [Denitrovibrio sp.]|nr:MAG: hypothetical protein C0603_08930 [Denitrovibrio sp.]
MKVEGKLWIDINGAGIAGHGRIQLLQLIDNFGSIKKAAESIGMSYKSAWDSINSLNEIFGKDLVERKTGGKGGGGTILTEHGKDLVKTYNYYSRIHELYLTDISKMNCIEAVINDTDGEYAKAITTGGDSFYCVLLDHEIKLSDKVNLFIKPTDIILVNSDDFETSAKNLLKTKVKSINVTNEKSEIILNSDKGTTLAVQITSASAEKLALKKDTEIYTLFKTASVLASIR